MSRGKLRRDQEKAMFAKKNNSNVARVKMPRMMRTDVKSPTKLMTKQMEKDIPPLYSTENKKPENITVHAHYFTPFSSIDWYITEYDGKDTMFGLVKGEYTELGYVSIDELKRLGMNVERDLYWKKKSLAKVKSEISKSKPVTIDFSHYIQNGKYHYEIFEDRKLVAKGSDFDTEKQAKAEMEKKIDLLVEKTKAKQKNDDFAKKGLSANEQQALPKSAKTYKKGDRTQISEEEPLYGKGGAGDRLDGKKGTIVSISKDKPRAKVKLDNGETIEIAKGFLKFKPLVEK